MDVKDVLKQFIEKCEERDGRFQCNLASNAILDWFGRTLRGSKAIEQYLRYDVWPQYDQNFATCTSCEPIESKPTHEQAKQTPVENTISCMPPVVPTAKSFESPPPSTRDLNNPPPLIPKKKIKKEKQDDDSNSSKRASKSSDSDIESDTKSYNLRSLTSEEGKNVIPSSPHRTLRKRIIDEAKIIVTRTASPTKRTKKVVDTSTSLDSMYRPEAKTKSAIASRSSKQSPKSNSCDLSKPYSELKYLESIGSIRTIRRAKHPGINKVPTAKTEVVTPFVSPESQNAWDRKTKLKIGYRVGLLHNDIQFALIIYEPLSMVTRRNLMEEFQQAAMEEEQFKAARAAKASPSILFNSPLLPMIDHDTSLSLGKNSTSVRVKPKNDKIATLRRLRF